MPTGDDAISLAGSSPPASPQVHGSSLPGSLGQPADEDSNGDQHPSSPASLPASSVVEQSPEPVAGQKRRAPDTDGDVSQYVGLVSRHFKLKKTDHDELTKVAARSTHELLIYSTAQTMKLRERIDTIQPADALWEIPRALHAEIEHYTYAVLCSPVLPTYVTESYPINVVLAILSANPSWGFTSEVKNDLKKREVVAERVRNRLTDRRSAIKHA
ncbi:hypothetical protein EVJ58_g9436, partial [Rhodofomes roseus]